MTIYPFSWMRVDIHKKTILAILMVGLVSCASDEEAAQEPITADDIHAIESEEPAPESWAMTDTNIEETDIDAEESTQSVEEEPQEIMSTFADETPAPVTEEDWTTAPADGMEQAEVGDTTPAVPEKHSENFLASMTDEREIDASFQPNLGGVYFVKAGDSVSGIAAKIYGSMERWREVAENNGIASPYTIHPGDPIRFSADTAKAQQMVERFDALPRSTVTVQKGDSLSKIAKRIYGKSHYWKVLLTLNEGQISSPNKIYVGAKLTFVKPQALNTFASSPPTDGDDLVAKTE